MKIPILGVFLMNKICNKEIRRRTKVRTDIVYKKNSVRVSGSVLTTDYRTTDEINRFYSGL